MDEYLKKDTGEAQPGAQGSDACRDEEKTNMADTAISTVLPDGEEPNAAEAAAITPSAYNEGSNAAETVPGKPVFKDEVPPRSPKSKWFLIGLAIYGGILLAVSVFLQASLWQYLDRSQAEMDRLAAEQAAKLAYEKALFQAPQLAFEAWQSERTADYWTDLWYAAAPNSLDERESVREFMAERFAPNAAEAYKAAGFTNEAPVYVLKNGEESLARVTLTGSELDWSVSEVELLMEGTCSLSVTVADRCRVYCNGKALGEEYAEAAEDRFNYDPLEKKLKGAVTWVSYHVEGLLLEPELVVEPPEGYTAVQTEDGDYMLGPGGDVSAYTDKSVQFVKAYLYYYMRGYSNAKANQSKALAYLTPGTKAYNDLNNTYVGVRYAASYSNVDTSKTFVGDVLVWADNCFSVDVIYDADCTYKGKHVDFAEATMRIYFLQKDNGYIISNFEVL